MKFRKDLLYSERINKSHSLMQNKSGGFIEYKTRLQI